MDKKLTFTKAHSLAKLSGELLAVFPNWIIINAQGEKEAVFTLSGDGQTVVLWVPNNVNDVDVQAVINAHDSTPLPDTTLKVQPFIDAMKGSFSRPRPAYVRTALLLLRTKSWEDLEDLIIEKKGDGSIGQAKYNAIKVKVAEFNIPINLS